MDPRSSHDEYIMAMHGSWNRKTPDRGMIPGMVSCDSFVGTRWEVKVDASGGVKIIVLFLKVGAFIDGSLDIG